MSRLDKFNALLVALIFAAMPAWAQFTIPFATGAAKSGGGSSTPSIAQVVGGTGACGTFATNPSISCSITPASGNYLVAVETSEGAATSLTTPTATGLTFTALGTPSTSMGMYVSTVTSATTYSVTLAASTTGGVSFIGQIYEAHNVNGTGDGATYASQATCASCTGPSLTTTTNGDLLISAFISSSNPTTCTYTSPFTTDPTLYQNTSSGLYACNGYDVQATSGAITAAWTNGTTIAGTAGIGALKP